MNSTVSGIQMDFTTGSSFEVFFFFYKILVMLQLRFGQKKVFLEDDIL